MNDEQAFLQAIRESPDDHALRLIFADWLEDRGDTASRARAEFIRVQFALHDLPPPTSLDLGYNAISDASVQRLAALGRA